MTPDGKYLWWMGKEVVIGPTVPGKAKCIEPLEETVRGEIQDMQFDAKQKVILLETPKGLFVCDYAGQVRSILRRTPNTTDHRSRR